MGGCAPAEILLGGRKCKRPPTIASFLVKQTLEKKQGGHGPPGNFSRGLKTSWQ